MYNGRWPTTFGSIMGWAKAAMPLFLLWIYGMTHGRGLTVQIMNLKLLQWLAPWHIHCTYYISQLLGIIG
jgi:hypothetical protein